jgi:hypothetical protein
MTYRKDGTDRAPATLIDGQPRHAHSVGWLDDIHAFDVAVPSVQPLLKLMPLIWRCRALQTRGIEPCPLCLKEGRPDPERLVSFASPERGVTVLGSAELWIPAPSGDVWVGPDLLVHYVAEHGYAPPNEFWIAVDAFNGSRAWDAELVAQGFLGRSSS